ncbi:MAG: hypothetical protein M5U01_12885 [Ardenticatenaceae bacterium]|nr:hypothetical protein [Ardenticatenaceae bacterium]HBY92392.1 hypothetical protein [Chloroflexota bacterium]
MKRWWRSLDGFLRHSLVGRLLFALVIGVVLAWVLSETAFHILSDSDSRAPQRIELVIPAGTAERVAAGESVPSIPPELVFVVGDVLVVKNEDTASHQLGPVWVPPGASASLAMDQANDYSYACTFRPSRSLGLTIRSRATALTRIQAVVMAGPPMGILMALYSFVLWPLRPVPDRRPAEQVRLQGTGSK